MAVHSEEQALCPMSHKVCTQVGECVITQVSEWYMCEPLVLQVYTCV